MGYRDIAKNLARYVKYYYSYMVVKIVRGINAAYRWLLPLIYFFKFLFSHYDYRQYNPLNMRKNLLLIANLGYGEWLESDSKGLLKKVITPRAKKFWAVKNFLLAGAFRHRLEKIVYLSFLTFLLELTNPFDKKSLNWIISRKLEFAKRIISRVQRINGKLWDTSLAEREMKTYQKRSLLQYKVIHDVIKAVSQQKEGEMVKEARIALKKGLFPLLITRGCSGSYWMRNTQREIIGLFKPFDEEIHAPNNPIGARYQGALGERRTRIGIRVGEASHREVAAFIIDKFFSFGIVPNTCYASFTHHVFFDSRENLYGIRRKKEKYGSFQEYVSGFQPYDKLTQEEKAKIAPDEYQLLVVLDVIIGNTDRNSGNFLLSDEKIAAVDHGLCFPDIHDYYTVWYWEIELGKTPFYPAIIELLKNFPFEAVSRKLTKRCFISNRSLARMKERIALFTLAIEAGLDSPSKLAPLMKSENLRKLTNLDAALQEKALEIIQEYLQNLS